MAPPFGHLWAWALLQRSACDECLRGGVHVGCRPRSGNRARLLSGAHRNLSYRLDCRGGGDARRHRALQRVHGVCLRRDPAADGHAAVVDFPGRGPGPWSLHRGERRIHHRRVCDPACSSSAMSVALTRAVGAFSFETKSLGDQGSVAIVEGVRNCSTIETLRCVAARVPSFACHAALTSKIALVQHVGGRGGRAGLAEAGINPSFASVATNGHVRARKSLMLRRP